MSEQPTENGPYQKAEKVLEKLRSLDVESALQGTERLLEKLRSMPVEEAVWEAETLVNKLESLKVEEALRSTKKLLGKLRRIRDLRAPRWSDPPIVSITCRVCGTEAPTFLGDDPLCPRCRKAAEGPANASNLEP